jgi:hypothetical protein
MSVDIIMYKVQALTDDELRQIRDINVADLNTIDDCELKEYSADEASLARLKHIMPYVRPIRMTHTQTDYKACCIANGMPKETSSYSMCHHYGGGCTVSFDGGYIRLTADDLEKFTTTEPRHYYVIKRKHIDADVDGWVARTLMTELKNALNAGDDSDLSYTPIQLNRENCEILCKTLVNMYDQEELYPNAEFGKFMLELMRAMYSYADNVFIEFQD